MGSTHDEILEAEADSIVSQVPEHTVFADNTSLMVGAPFLFDTARALDPGTHASSLAHIIELLCLYEHIAVDNTVLRQMPEALKVKHTFLKEVVGVEVPVGVYKRVLDGLQSFRRALELNYDDILMAMSDLPVLYQDKAFFERLSDEPLFLSDGTLNPESLMGSRLQRSGDHFLRTLFYNELARTAGLPYVPHSCRSDFLLFIVLLDQRPNLVKELNLQINRDGYSVQRAILSHIEEDIIPVLDRRRSDLSWRYLSRLPLPPLVRYFQNKLQGGRFRFLADAIEHERRQDDCKAFRKWCHSIEEAFEDGDFDQVDRGNLELDEVTHEWTQRLAVEGRTEQRKLVVGTLVTSEISVPDPVIPLPKKLRRRKHIWFLHKLLGS